VKWTESGKSEFEQTPSGSHLARCYALIDLGTQEVEWQGKKKLQRKVRLSFELPMARMEGRFKPEMKGRPFTVNTTQTMSLAEKANLRKYIEGWRGKRFGPGEIDVFDPKKLIGQPCRLNLVESETGGFTNIQAFAPATGSERAAMPPPFNAQVYLSLDPDEFNQAAFDSLSDKVKEKIKTTPEWYALQNPEPDEPEDR
jgi:hypothetical protein